MYLCTSDGNFTIPWGHGSCEWQWSCTNFSCRQHDNMAVEMRWNFIHTKHIYTISNKLFVSHKVRFKPNVVPMLLFEKVVKMLEKVCLKCCLCRLWNRTFCNQAQNSQVFSCLLHHRYNNMVYVDACPSKQTPCWNGNHGDNGNICLHTLLRSNCIISSSFRQYCKAMGNTVSLTSVK